MKLPQLDPVEVLKFESLPRVATGFYRGTTLGGLGRPKMACLECVDTTLALYDEVDRVEFRTNVSSVTVRTGGEFLWLVTDEGRYRLRAADVSVIRLRGKPIRCLEYLDRHETTDSMPGLGPGNRVLGPKAAALRKGMWVGLWKRTLMKRGARAS